MKIKNLRLLSQGCVGLFARMLIYWYANLYLGCAPRSQSVLPRNKILGFTCLLVLCCATNSSFAFGWQDLWLTPNQQGEKLLTQNKPKEAALKFTNPQWRGLANYRAGNYQAAVKEFSQNNTPTTNYNRGNALAYLGKFQEAIAAYDITLKQDPDFKDALYNKKIIEQLLKQHDQQNSAQNGKNNKNQQPHSQQNDSNSKGNQQNNKDKNSENHANNSQSKQQQDKNSNQTQQNNKDRKDSNDEDNSPIKSQQKDSEQSPHNSGEQSKAEKKQNAEQGQEQKQSDLKNNQQTQLTDQQQQKLKQWLQQIPDDPGGLLRRKFLRDHLRMQEQQG